MKKWISILLALTLCLSLCACGNKAPENAAAEEPESEYDYYFEPCAKSIESFEGKVMPYYAGSLEEVSDMTVWFVNGVSDVAFLSMEDVVKILKDLNTSDYVLTMEKSDEKKYVFLSRENDSYMIADYNLNRLIFSDIQAFISDPKAVNALDLVSMTTNGEENNTLIAHSSMFYKGADILIIDMDYYGIPMIYQNGTGYLPLQTVADLLVSRMGAYLLYNGQAVILAGDLSTGGESVPQTVGDIYFSAPMTKKSNMLKIFNYNELCLALDHCYGLKQEHGIDSFWQLFAQSGLDMMLYSDDAADTFRALYELTYGYFADLHSSVTAPSYKAEINTFGMDNTSQLYSQRKIYSTLQVYDGVRSEFYPEGCPGYEEVGNTAYITFDSFQTYAEDYYALELTPNTEDTMELILYANEQIKRENSPIENVVLDLTCNTGGELNSAVSVIAWMLGDCTLSMEDVITGAQGTALYTFDADRNGEMDENDYCGFENYHLYCLVSPNSFSCGNLVPYALQSSRFVTLIGDDSSGGACAVYPMSTADGTIFQISGPYRISVMYNGTYYSVDEGVEVENYIDKLEHLYDREYLTQYINDLP